MHRQRLYFSRDHVIWYCSSVPSSWHPFIIILYDRSLFDDDSFFLSISSACGYCSDILSFRLVRLSVHRASTRIHSCAFPPLIAPFRYDDIRNDERRLVYRPSLTWHISAEAPYDKVSFGGNSPLILVHRPLNLWCTDTHPVSAYSLSQHCLANSAL